MVHRKDNCDPSCTFIGQCPGKEVVRVDRVTLDELCLRSSEHVARVLGSRIPLPTVPPDSADSMGSPA